VGGTCQETDPEACEDVSSAQGAMAETENASLNLNLESLYTLLEELSKLRESEICLQGTSNVRKARPSEEAKFSP